MKTRMPMFSSFSMLQQYCRLVCMSLVRLTRVEDHAFEHNVNKPVMYAQQRSDAFYGKKIKPIFLL